MQPIDRTVGLDEKRGALLTFGIVPADPRIHRRDLAWEGLRLPLCPSWKFIDIFDRAVHRERVEAMVNDPVSRQRPRRGRGMELRERNSEKRG